jgi:TolB protein
MHRRHFLATLAGSALAGGVSSVVTSCRSPHDASAAHSHPPRTARFFFTSQGRTGVLHADGSGLRYFDFKKPDQVTWQPGPAFPDGRRVLFLSMEARRDGPGRPFEEYYTQTPTHLWIHDLDTGSLTEIATRDRLAVFYTPALLLANERLLVQVVRHKVGQIFSMNLDGTDAREFTRAGEGLPYGLSLSPDGRRVAYHLASPRGYEIWTCDPEGRDRIRVAGQRGHLYFGTSWSPDGRWVLYQDCHHDRDPGHDWSDVCVGRPDGSEHRVLTEGQAMWFGATYGPAENRGGGSNVPAWDPQGRILFPRRLPGSRVPWEYQAQRPDTDHFNREFKPDQARGGTGIVRMDPATGAITELTAPGAGQWDFRASASPDGRHLVFCRAATGGSPSIWVMRADGSRPARLTEGLDGRGADHPRWVS